MIFSDLDEVGVHKIPRSRTDPPAFDPFSSVSNLRCCRWVVQRQWKVAKSPVSSDASVPRFPRRKLLELPKDSFRLPLRKSFQMSDLNVDSVDCQSRLPGSSTSHSMCKTCDQDSWRNLEAEVLKNEAVLILLTRPPTYLGSVVFTFCFSGRSHNTWCTTQPQGGSNKIVWIVRYSSAVPKKRTLENAQNLEAYH